MKKIIWDESFGVGLQTIDAQHRRILQFINVLGGHPDADVRSEVVSDILSDLTQYAIEHFRHEEEILEAVGYPELDEQRSEHLGYRMKVIDLSLGAVDHVEEVPVALREFVADWWVRHILQSDMKYKPFVAAVERGEPATEFPCRKCGRVAWVWRMPVEGGYDVRCEACHAVHLRGESREEILRQMRETPA